MNDAFEEIGGRVGAGLRVLAERLPRVVEDPQAYPSEAMLLAAVAALALVLLLLVVMTVVGAIQRDLTMRRIGVRRRWDVAGRRIAIVLAALFSAAALVSFAPAVPPVGAACASCHEIAPAVDAWRVDTHAAVSCYGCHARPGVFGVAQAGVDGAARYVRSQETTVGAKAPVFQWRCLRCHDELAEGVLEGPIRMRHSDVIEARYECLACHPTVGHTALVRTAGPIVRTRMSVCLGCHDGVEAPSGCTTCHESRPSDSDASAPGGSAALRVRCDDCHSEQVRAGCIACHGLELPHPPIFLGQHAGLSQRDPALCARCHEIASPRRACACHMDGETHGAYESWFPRHGQVAVTNYPGGCLCHEDSFCAFCHQAVGR